MAAAAARGKGKGKGKYSPSHAVKAAYTGDSQHVNHISKHIMERDEWWYPTLQMVLPMLPRKVDDPHSAPSCDDAGSLTLCVLDKESDTPSAMPDPLLLLRDTAACKGTPVYVSDTHGTVYDIHVVPVLNSEDQGVVIVQGVGACWEKDTKKRGVFSAITSDDAEYKMEGDEMRPAAPRAPHAAWGVDVTDVANAYRAVIVAVARNGQGGTQVMDTAEVAARLVHLLLQVARASTPSREVWSLQGSAPLHTAVNAAVDAVVAAQPVDIHPGSHGVVNDLLHPSLYPHITSAPSTAGQYKANDEGSNMVGVEAGDFTDVWGRPYESSVFQWLPSHWNVSPSGQVHLAPGCHINAPDTALPLVPALEGVFTAALPCVEAALEYMGRTTQTFPGGTPAPSPCLAGTTLQIVPKVVEMTIPPGGTYQGVWHYEAMSHENIVATILYVARLDEGLQGDGLDMQRAYTECEAHDMKDDMSQFTHEEYKEELIAAVVPLGVTPLPEGTLLVFPNSHAHRVLPITNTTAKPLKRRLVAGFVVNPAVKLPSTATCPNYSTLRSLPEAKQHREQLMKERRVQKQSMNQREVDLCEH